MTLDLFGGVLLGLLLVDSARLSAALARRLGSRALAPAVWKCLVGLAVFLVTEGLSIGNHLTPPAILEAWILLAALLHWARRRITARATEAPAPDTPPGKDAAAARLAAAAIGVVLVVTLVTAVASPPNNWDSQIYHNARVMQWLDHASVAHYYTPIDRQLRMPPLASYFRLNLFALTGSDVLFNLVQWVFFALSTLECALLARLVGGDATAAAVAAVFAATLPAAILQGSGTQNDLIAGGYLLSALVVLVRWLRAPIGAPPLSVVLIGVSLGLGALVKGTDYVPGTLVAAATVVALAASRSASRREALFAFAGIALGLTLNVPHLARNREYFGRALPHHEAVSFRTWLQEPPAMSLKRAVSQIVRSAVLQLDLLERSDAPGEIIDRGVDALHGWLGISTADPRITEVARPHLARKRSLESGKPQARFPLDEDVAGNTLHFLLGLGAAAAALHPRLRRREVLALFTAAWVSWVALAVAIKWMPWNSRLQIPALLLLAAPVGLVVARSRKLAVWVVAILCTLSLPYLLFNASRPLLPRAGSPSIFQASRWENLFRGRPQLRAPVERVLAELPASCSRTLPVGLRFGPNEWEYPFWVGARNAGRPLRFLHTPASAADPGLCAVISDACPVGPFCVVAAGAR